jgi:hypothetical protein
MRSSIRGLLLATMLAIVCAVEASAQSKQVVFNEILIRRSGGSPNVDQLVELRNTGSSPINVGGWVFCHEFNYNAVFPAGTTIAAGGYLTVHFNQGGTNTATDVYFPGQDLSFTSDLGLYINGNNFSSASNMHAFVQFGGVPSGRQSVAAQAGLWTLNSFLPATSAGQSVELCGSGDATQTNSWATTGSPTIGQMNGCGVAVSETSWTSVKSLLRNHRPGRPF